MLPAKCQTANRHSKRLAGEHIGALEAKLAKEPDISLRSWWKPKQS